MFVGHFAVALAAKRATPRLSLPLLFAAVAFLDIVWPALILLGVEHARISPGITAASPLDLYDYPYSHSLLTSLGWSVLFAAPLLFARRGREALVLGGCVFSHFVLDFVTHRPDLPLAPGGAARFGLGLWNHRTAAVLVEGIMFAAAIWIYVRGTRSTGRFGSWGLGILMAVLAAAWLGGVYGPPPPGIGAVAWSALIAIPLTLMWAWAIDRKRVPAY